QCCGDALCTGNSALASRADRLRWITMSTQSTAHDPQRSAGTTRRARRRSLRAGLLRAGTALVATVGLGAGLALTGGTATADPAPGQVEMPALPQIPAPQLPQVEIPQVEIPPVQVPDVPLPGGQNLPDVLGQAGVPITQGPDGATIGQTGPQPLAPANFATPQITPSEGAVVGVAQPIIITFPEPVTDHAAAERAMRVTTDNGVTGAFHWFSDTQVRWRPENLWPGHTQV